jgi:uncharacterized protein YkwD
MSRTRPIRVLLVALLGGLVLVTVTFTQSAQASPSGNYERSVQVNTNVQRTHSGRVALKSSSCLDRFAERQARAMAKRREMYHQNIRRILRVCKLSSVGENVAYGYPNGRSAVSAWMNSKGHRANILKKRYRLIAVGAYRDSHGTWYVSQVFGRSR